MDNIVNAKKHGVYSEFVVDSQLFLALHLQ